MLPFFPLPRSFQIQESESQHDVVQQGTTQEQGQLDRNLRDSVDQRKLCIVTQNTQDEEDRAVTDGVTGDERQGKDREEDRFLMDVEALSPRQRER